MQQVLGACQKRREVRAFAERDIRWRGTRRSGFTRRPILSAWLTVPIPEGTAVAKAARRFLARQVVLRQCRIHAFHVSPNDADVLVADRPNDAILLAHDLLDSLHQSTGYRAHPAREVLLTPHLSKTRALQEFIERFKHTPEWGWWPDQRPLRGAVEECA